MNARKGKKKTQAPETELAGSPHQPQSMTSGPLQSIVQEVAQPANARKGKKRAQAPATELAMVTAAMEMAAAVPAATCRSGHWV